MDTQLFIGYKETAMFDKIFDYWSNGGAMVIYIPVHFLGLPQLILNQDRILIFQDSILILIELVIAILLAGSVFYVLVHKTLGDRPKFDYDIYLRMSRQDASEFKEVPHLYFTRGYEEYLHKKQKEYDLNRTIIEVFSKIVFVILGFLIFALLPAKNGEIVEIVFNPILAYFSIYGFSVLGVFVLSLGVLFEELLIRFCYRFLIQFFIGYKQK